MPLTVFEEKEKKANGGSKAKAPKSAKGSAAASGSKGKVAVKREEGADGMPVDE